MDRSVAGFSSGSAQIVWESERPRGRVEGEGWREVEHVYTPLCPLTGWACVIEREPVSRTRRNDSSLRTTLESLYRPTAKVYGVRNSRNEREIYPGRSGWQFERVSSPWILTSLPQDTRPPSRCSIRGVGGERGGQMSILCVHAGVYLGPSKNIYTARTLRQIRLLSRHSVRSVHLVYRSVGAARTSPIRHQRYIDGGSATGGGGGGCAS